MFDMIRNIAGNYWEFYCHLVRSQWHSMTPAKYGVLLVSIGLMGFLLLKSANKRS